MNLTAPSGMNSDKIKLPGVQDKDEIDTENDSEDY